MNDSTQKPGPGNPDRRDGHGPEPEPESGRDRDLDAVAPEGADGAAGTDDGPDSAPGTGSGGTGSGGTESGGTGSGGTESEGARSEGAELGGTGPEGERSDGAELGGTDSGGVGEEALRLLMHRAVDDLAPSPHSLEQLRRAVPVRRTRRRQALVGAVAAVVLGGAALPALVHVATTGGGGANDRPANAGSSHRTPGTAGGQRGGGSGGQGTDRPSDRVETDKHDRRHGGKKDKPTEEDPKGDSGGTAPDPSGTLNATSPTCTRTQLSSGAGSAGSADAEGRVYGSFRVSNVSDRACTVEGSGAVNASAQGGADTSRIFVVDHTAGDAATDLPDPATQPGTLILQPGQAYEVRFAWIPASGGGTSGCSTNGGTPSPDPTPPPDGSSPDDPGAGESGGTPGGEEPPAASVLVSHTPEAGDPAAGSVTVSGACAGTVYRTGLLAAS
ncbi:hypothetical protein [Streptomyces coffeae]|uniref:DUF4232 domain-containing protein n=1 Tax=Streptomyces coffeae TaxID=621382 RepID=A0ABS1N5A4_9ACTN|nr:hypothetical protein [Streptomyces coffeae]MBL1095099.1 hypothetical protein [Streptomyces coffeae]